MAVDLKEIKDDLERFDNLIKMINFDYERFFARILKNPPIVYEREINKLINKYNINTIQNVSLRFKFNNLVAKYLTFREKWNKKMMEYEGIKKPLPVWSFQETMESSSQESYQSELDKLPPGINKEKIIRLIEDKIAEYRDKGIKNVEVKVNIVDNKPKLIIRPVK